MRVKTMKQIALVAALALPLSVNAGGQHEGRHGHDPAGSSDHGGHAHEHGQASPAGEPGKTDEAARTIHVTMNDTMRFHPSDLKVRAGETVRFVIRNEGKIRHEMVLGTESEIREHMAMMKAMPNMQHQEANSVFLAPGESGEIVWKFTQPGEVDFACLVPGHYEAGMKGEIRVGGKGE